MSLKISLLQSPRRLVLIALALATLLKVAWAFTSAGTCDASFFFAFAEKLQHHSIDYLYRNVTLFNHMPLTGWTMQGIYAATFGNYQAFATVIRLMCIAADALVVLAIVRRREKLGPLPWWALGCFALSPVSLMISGFHGNVDPIMTALVFFAALAAWEERPLQCALLFALACNVKIVPILLAPVFFFYWSGRSWRTAWRFTAVFAAVMLAGIAWPLFRCPMEFARQVLGYSSYWGTWGITYWITAFGGAAVSKVSYTDLSPLQNQIMFALKLLIIAGTLTVAWRRRKVAGPGIFGSLMAVYLLMFTFAPGVGTQYMVWSAPFLLIAAPRWYIPVTAAATVYLFAFYDACSKEGFPWIVANPRGPEIAVWGPWSNVAWLAFVAMTGWWFWPRSEAAVTSGKEQAIAAEAS